MRLSIVIICWNDLKDIAECLQSVYRETSCIDFEVIVTDNGSTDGSVAYVREHFPAARIVENRVNLGFGPGNNCGFRVARGEYVLILNPDTIIRERALEKLVAFADRHPEAGAFGLRVLNIDGSPQGTAQPLPTVRGVLLAALYLRFLGRFSERFISDSYVGWQENTEREIGFQAGCCLLVRGSLLKELGGFDERFFHQYEDADLCHRIWEAGSSVRFCPSAEIVHIGGQNRGRYPIKVILETQRSKYRYFQKHYGKRAVGRVRWVALIGLGLRYFGYSLRYLFKPSRAIQDRMHMYRVLIKWHWRLDPVRFADHGEEPDVGYGPLAAVSRLIS
jgi:GT2 family glycosyltransferase